jgi:hypothetical protein
MFGSQIALSGVGKLFYKDYMDAGANQIQVDFDETAEHTLNEL